MNLRVVLTVAVAVALLGASVPAIDAVRVSHGDARVDGALDRIERAAEQLRTDNDAIERAEVAATRRLELHLPAGSWGTAGLEGLRFQRGPSNDTEVRWRLHGGSQRVRRLSGVSIPVAHRDLRIPTGGRVSVRLRLLRRDGDRRVVLDVPDFTTQRATSVGHARSTSTVR